MKTLFGEQIDTLNIDSIYNHLYNGEYSHLSDVELVYSIVGNEEVAARVCQTAGRDWSCLFKFSASELMKVPGVGKKKAVALVAAMEMGRRRNMQGQPSRDIIRTSADVYNLMHPLLADLGNEELWVIPINGACKVINKVKVSMGGRKETTADITVILKKAIENNARGMILVHNHPSGVCRPSAPDDNLTERLEKAAKLIDIKLQDHVIVCDGCFYSYADEGRLTL